MPLAPFGAKVEEGLRWRRAIPARSWSAWSAHGTTTSSSTRAPSGARSTTRSRPASATSTSSAPPARATPSTRARFRRVIEVLHDEMSDDARRAPDGRRHRPLHGQRRSSVSRSPTTSASASSRSRSRSGRRSPIPEVLTFFRDVCGAFPDSLFMHYNTGRVGRVAERPPLPADRRRGSEPRRDQDDDERPDHSSGTSSAKRRS